MTDPTLALSELQAMYAELVLTQKGYVQMPQPLPAGTHWANAMQHYWAAYAALQAAPVPAVFGASLDAHLPRLAVPATVKQVPAGANIDNVISGTPSTGGIRYVLAAGSYPACAPASRTFTQPVWIEAATPGWAEFASGAGGRVHAVYWNGLVNTGLRGLGAHGAANTGFKWEGCDLFELDDCRAFDCLNQGFLMASLNKRCAVWNCYANGNGSAGFGGANKDQCHNFYMGHCDTFLAVNNVSVDAPFGSCFQLGGSVTHWVVANNTFDTVLSTWPVFIYTMSAQTPESSDGLWINNLVGGGKGYGVQGSGANPNAASQKVTRTMTYATPLGGFYPGGQFVLADPNFPNVDPLYANRGGRDLRLSAGSPAIGKGDPLWTPPLDANGKQRVTADLGAYAA